MQKKKRGYPFPPLEDYVAKLNEIQDERREDETYFKPMLNSAFSPFMLVARFRRLMQQILYPIATSKEEDKREFLRDYLTRTKLNCHDEVLCANQATIFNDKEQRLTFPVNDKEFTFSQVNAVGPLTYEEGIISALQLLQVHFYFNFVDLYKEHSLIIDHLIIDQEQHWNFTNDGLPSDLVVSPERMHIVNLKQEFTDSKQISEQLSSLGVWHLLTWSRKEKSEESDASPLEQISMLVVVHTSDPESEIQTRKERPKGLRNVTDEKLKMMHIHAAYIPQINLERDPETQTIMSLSKYVPVSTHHIYIRP